MRCLGALKGNWKISTFARCLGRHRPLPPSRKGRETAELYQASPIKHTRATKAKVEARREALLDIIEVGRPITVRQFFYKRRSGDGREGRKSYGKVQTNITVMRRAELPGGGGDDTASVPASHALFEGGLIP